MNFIVTGAAGFIGSHFVELLLELGHKPIVIDKFTYASRLSNIPAEVETWNIDINHRDTVSYLLDKYKPKAIFNFAAESHVCRSIEEPSSFIHSNINGVFALLQESLHHWRRNPDFKFIQISTDEVFGSIEPFGLDFKESSPYKPNSPYAASKAAGDHLVAAWNHTYGLPAIITHCSNNYGPRQHPEKLIPLMIKKAINNELLTLHGDGQNIRDWIHVKDHCRGVWAAYEKGITKPLDKGVQGFRYCFGGDKTLTNLQIVEKIKWLTNSKSEIVFVEDRPGNDRKYAINDKYAQRWLEWKREIPFDEGFYNTVKWYMENQEWYEEEK